MKKIPMRQCVGCREMKPKKELVRVVKSPEGEISMDLRGKAPGRGAYVCHSVECLRRAMKSRALERGFEMTIPQEIYERLQAELEAKSDE
jgi:hypothetical protein